jgi:hypothetical protein
LHHITGKNLVVLTNNGQLYQIDSTLFSARRPHTDNLVLGEKAPEEVKKRKDERQRGEWFGMIRRLIFMAFFHSVFGRDRRK